MDNTNYTTEHRKGQHLLSEERHEIEVRLKDGWSVCRIARHLGRPYFDFRSDAENNVKGDAEKLILSFSASPFYLITPRRRNK